MYGYGFSPKSSILLSLKFMEISFPSPGLTSSRGYSCE